MANLRLVAGGEGGVDRLAADLQLLDGEAVLLAAILRLAEPLGCAGCVGHGFGLY